MHSSVLQNKKYIQFAEENTVEVITLSSLQRGIDAGDRRAATYEAKDEQGNEVEYLVEFPNLTVEQMLALSKSKARQYNQTGKIPYTSLVDPHTLEEVQGWSGGQSSKTIMEVVKEYRRTLTREHGKAVSRKTWNAVTRDGRGDVAEALQDDDFASALRTVDKLAKKYDDEPDALRAKVDELKVMTLQAASARLDELQTRVAQGDSRASRDLRPLARALKGTDLEERVNRLLEEASEL